HVFCPAVQLGMTFLTAKTLGLGDGNPLNADFMKRLLHFVELEGFDDRLDLFHRLLISRSAWRRLSGPKHNPCHPDAVTVEIKSAFARRQPAVWLSTSVPNSWSFCIN